jgi:hypothetical protein
MFAELLQKLDTMDAVARETQSIYEQNIKFYHPSESSLIENTLNEWSNQANSIRKEITDWLSQEEDGGVGWLPVVVAGVFIGGALVWAAERAAPLIDKKLDLEKQKIDQAYEVAKLGPERAALYQANLEASPDLTIPEMLSQIKPAVTPGFSWGVIAAVGALAWLWWSSGRRS